MLDIYDIIKAGRKRTNSSLEHTATTQTTDESFPPSKRTQRAGTLHAIVQVIDVDPDIKDPALLTVILLVVILLVVILLVAVLLVVVLPNLTFWVKVEVINKA
jgi:hypothetical protein